MFGKNSILVPDNDSNGPSSSPVITLQHSNFMVDNHLIFSHVPPNVVASPSPYPTGGEHQRPPVAPVARGCFVGFNAAEPKSRHVVPLGELKGIRFMSIFRFKVWWSTHWTGTHGRDLEHETQILVLDRCEDSARPYVVVLPLLEGPFRASLQPGKDDFVDICVESGSTKVSADSFRSVLYMHAGNDPFELVKEAVRVARVHLGTFKLMEEKAPPGIVDKFGWCTWDAFYLKVHPGGVWDGVRSLAEGGCPPGLVLIDDGWQSISHDGDDPATAAEGMNMTAAGEQMPCRLIKFEENHKFRDYGSPKDGEKGMGAFVRDLKDTFNTVEYVYVWHALCGYWGGLRPNVPGLPEAKVVRPELSPGLKKTMEDLAVDKIVRNGVGLVPPDAAHELYEGLHSHLESSGIDGVKVDVIHVLEMVGEEYGGRVELAKAYYKALTTSLQKHFNGNGVIASMEHCNDFMFLGTQSISLGRVGDDFWCTDPSGDPNATFWLQGCHMVHCAYNSLWMANFIRPDWDMFQSTHPCAAFHAASRAISGGPIYVSDSPAHHDFPLLKKLVFPDGSIPRCQHYALPARDCLFRDPLHDGNTMLKIWNLNKYTGVVGAFNCQGGGWCRETRRNQCASQYSRAVSCTAGAGDVEWDQATAPPPGVQFNAAETFALYLFRGKRLVLAKRTEAVEIELEPFNFELVTVSPVAKFGSKGVHYGPIGLVNMLNTGGAIHSIGLDDRTNTLSIVIKGCGEMRLYASHEPTACNINGADVPFIYEDQMVSVLVPWLSPCGCSVIQYLF